MIIYIAGPYSAPTGKGRLANTKTAMEAGLRILMKGHHPIIPHLTHYFDAYVSEQHGVRLNPKTYYEWDLAILERGCDALLYLAPSPGADKELARARQLCLEIFYSVEEVPIGHNRSQRTGRQAV